MFFKIDVLKNLVNYAGKLLWLVKFEKFLRTPFVTEHLRWLVLLLQVLYKILQNSQENTCNEKHFLIQLQTLASNFIRKKLFFQLAITCSKLTMETLGQGVKYIQS